MVLDIDLLLSKNICHHVKLAGQTFHVTTVHQANSPLYVWKKYEDYDAIYEAECTH